MATIADVAKAAGVSISTVSYVMSGKRAISRETRERVEEAIVQLSFSPHASARSLASGSNSVIGLQAPLRPGVDAHVVMEIVAGVVREARSHFYDVLLLTGDEGEGLERASKSSLVDALLVMDVAYDDPRIKTLESLRTPAVLIGVPSEDVAITCVDFDFEAAGALAASRLAELGHRKVALLGAPAEVIERHTSYAKRLSRGFARGCETAGIAGSVHPCPAGAEATSVLDTILSNDADVSAIFVHNEAALPHIASHVETLASPPQMIALAPNEFSRNVSGLSDLIDIPAERLGALAAETLWRLIEDREVSPLTLLKPHLNSQLGAA
ncbi:LacI family DNA-binding transcriptional regulator [Demequina sp.]|uniref:LacI family DNA-binding transcriptional regulator n=1 Tax=Demequina sp. TaxID=2050685 RepID=UPI003D136AAE